MKIIIVVFYKDMYMAVFPTDGTAMDMERQAARAAAWMFGRAAYTGKALIEYSVRIEFNELYDDDLKLLEDRPFDKEFIMDEDLYDECGEFLNE